MANENHAKIRSMASEILNEGEANCPLCCENDTIDMVACDTCRRWYHFKCVGVDSSIANKDWICSTCILSLKHQISKNTVREKELSAKLEELEHRIQQMTQDPTNEHGDYMAAKTHNLTGNVVDIAKIANPSVLCDQNQSTPRLPSAGISRNITTNNDGEHQIEHFLARQTITRDLPPFTGSPEQWPTFLSTFEYSTSACKFSNVENLCRLQKALKGDARKMVECYLTHPSNVPLIIDTLKMLFGRPAVIIQTQIDKIKKMPPPRADKLESLVIYAVQVRNLLAALESANVKEYLSDIRLLGELVDRLPPQTRLDWGLHETRELNSSEPKLKQFSKWLDVIAQCACNVMNRVPQISKQNINDRVNLHKTERNETEHVTRQDSIRLKKCRVCEKTCRNATECKTFGEMNVNDRWQTVIRLKLCRLCLFQHKSPVCKKPKECNLNGCKKLHHQLLHKNDKQNETGLKASNCTKSVIATTQRIQSSILYRIIPVTLKHNDVTVDTFAFIDDGSSVTLIEEQIARQLRLKGKLKPLCMRWTDGQSHTELKSRIVTFGIAPHQKPNNFFEITAQTIASLDLPTQTIDRKELIAKYEHLRQVQFESYENAKPTIIIGLDNWHLCVPRNVSEGNRYEPVATKTCLGWDLCGTLPSKNTYDTHQVNVHVCECADDRLEQMMKQFHSLDAIGVSRKNDYLLTEEEKRAKKIMEELTVRKDNYYEVGLLWKYDQCELPDSYGMACQRLLCLERKLLGNPQRLQTFKNHFEQHVKKGFIRKLSPLEVASSHKRVWYLPLFFVENVNKPGKIRLVFDAAAKVNGISLNSMLIAGPDLVSSLLDILIRFRIHTFAVTGDIREMFHMVRVRYDDQMAQRILWRDCDQTRNPEVYAMTVLTFGATCSPYQAQYIMRLNASKFNGKYASTVKSITENTYVDDVLDGRETEEELIKFVQEMQHIHLQGGFEIRNFKSNSPKLRNMLNQSESSNTSFDLTGCDRIEKVLGIFWNFDEDCITFSLRFNKANKNVLNGTRRPTKREILVTLMSIYDPLGLVAHFVAGLKAIQQETWRRKLKWDENIPDDLDKRWRKWLCQLKAVESLCIPRRYITVPWSECTHVSLHTFVDAGEMAYAAAVYIRVVAPNKRQVSLVTAKVKSVPLKYTPIPRLELQAATIGARLYNTVQKALDLHIHSKYFWTDSTVVLSWLHSQKKLPVWVACRVGEIKETTDINQWRWLPTHENVADLPTKWRDVVELSAKSRWYRGPDFLLKDEQFWPKPKCEEENEAVPFELNDPTFEYIGLHSELTGIIDISRFSKWNRLLRATAYLFRFIRLIKKSNLTKERGVLKSEELQQAETFLFREAQKLYSTDIALLNQNGSVPKQSRLYKLSPMLDEDNIIRLRGRFENDYPIILPNTHRITMLLVMKVHEECAHQFSETVVNKLRKQFHIPRLRVLVKQIERQCQRCKIRLARPAPPEMSPLPIGRYAVNQAPFSHTGIDLFGPLMVTVHRKPEKRWVVIFTCLTIRAIHLEMVDEMSTDCFLMAFRNFIARRGQPLECYSDRGTNLVGAEKAIKAAYQEVDFYKIEEVTTSPSLKWHFNPPLSPHMGGAWERLIRSVKSGMRILIGPLHKPSPQVLNNILIEIESLVNSRPLTYVPLDSPENEVITPNHALLAYKNPGKPLGITVDAKVPKLLWRKSQQTLQRFYQQWILSYRPTLTRRSKWFEKPKPLEVGDIVVIIDENDKTRSFPKGRIVETRRSRDGIVRSATVKTSGGLYVRPAVMLAKLDVDVESVKDPTRPGV